MWTSPTYWADLTIAVLVASFSPNMLIMSSPCTSVNSTIYTDDTKDLVFQSTKNLLNDLLLTLHHLESGEILTE